MTTRAPAGCQHPLAQAFEQALASIDLRRLVHDALPPLPPARARVRVVAIGKAAPAMAAGALERWPERIERALVVAPDATSAGPLERADGTTLPLDRVVLLRASHPLPDERSVGAAEMALSLARGAARDLLVALVSGGASSLACAPCDGLTLERKREVVGAMLASGARIDEVNTIRRHLSRIKGGALTRAAAPGRVLALLASDVVDGAASDIGSGPTLPDRTTVRDAQRLVERYAPSLGPLPFVETLKDDAAAARRQRSRVIVSPADLADALARALRAQGYRVRVLLASTQDVATLADEYALAASSLGPAEALVRAAEPSLRLAAARTGKAIGRGGRSGHLGAQLSRRLPGGVTFMAAASDGVDGSSGAAGVVVDGELGARVSGGWSRVDAALAAFDTAKVLEEAGAAIRGGPTGINLADVHVLARR
jgi:glycerate 2-kinase